MVVGKQRTNNNYGVVTLLFVSAAARSHSTPVVIVEAQFTPLMRVVLTCIRGDLAIILALAFHNELEYCNINVRVNSGNDPSTSCEKLVNFRSVTPEISLLICVPVFQKWDKIGLPTFTCRAGWRIAVR